LQVNRDHVRELLGPDRNLNEIAERKLVPGIAIGLSVSGSGGDILIIEATRMPGKGDIRVTGGLRDVMKESAATAVSYVRSKADRLKLDPEWLKTIDLHLHVPRGGSSRDGANAGLAMFVAVASLLLDAPARSDMAVTGEITLRGNILPVSGVKDQVLAAHRAGIREIVLPVRNERDLEDVPNEVKNDLRVHFVSRVDEVLSLVLRAPEPPTSDDRDVPQSGGEARP
jgi:ATP-dependent Lon protease